MTQVFQFLICIVLFIIGALLSLFKKKPGFILVLFFMHLFELLTVGLKTGKEYGKKLPETIACTLCFGFTWWKPLRKQIQEETFTDKDFERTPFDLAD